MRDQLPTLAEMQAFVDSILKARCLRRYFTSSVLAPVAVIAGRQRSEATALSFLSTILVPKEMRSKFIVLHELCHILTDRYHGEDHAAHGPEFATLLLAMVSQFLGAEDCCELLAAFTRKGVAHSYREGKLP